MVSCVTFLQSQNAKSPILEASTHNEVNPEQPQKAFSPTSVIVDGIVKSPVNPVQP